MLVLVANKLHRVCHDNKSYVTQSVLTGVMWLSFVVQLVVMKQLPLHCGVTVARLSWTVEPHRRLIVLSSTESDVTGRLWMGLPEVFPHCCSQVDRCQCIGRHRH